MRNIYGHLLFRLLPERQFSLRKKKRKKIALSSTTVIVTSKVTVSASIKKEIQLVGLPGVQFKTYRTKKQKQTNKEDHVFMKPEQFLRFQHAVTLIILQYL